MMTLNNMINILDFKNATSPNYWRRVSEDHPLDLYIGKDELGNYSFEFVGSFKVNKKIRSSKLINVTHYKLPHGKKSMVLSLIEDDCLAQFCAFCNDIAESTQTLNDIHSSGYEAVCNLYFTWQKMFKNQAGLLSDNEIKGLIGELLFLRDELIPVYGISSSVSMWTGPDATKKDFSVENSWYEIKSIDYGKNSVKISSIEQLDSDIDGQLVIYQLEKMAPEFNGVSLNNLIESIMSMFTSFLDKDLFVEKLKEAGYSYESTYDSPVYAIRDISHYMVSKKFPKLERSKINKAINSAVYELTISELVEYRK